MIWIIIIIYYYYCHQYYHYYYYYYYYYYYLLYYYCHQYYYYYYFRDSSDFFLWDLTVFIHVDWLGNSSDGVAILMSVNSYANMIQFSLCWILAFTLSRLDWICQESWKVRRSRVCSQRFRRDLQKTLLSFYRAHISMISPLSLCL